MNGLDFLRRPGSDAIIEQARERYLELFEQINGGMPVCCCAELINTVLKMEYLTYDITFNQSARFDIFKLISGAAVD